jgi:hypothetical protein
MKHDQEIINLIGQKEKEDSNSSREFEDYLEVADEVASDLEVQNDANRALMEESQINYSQ